MQSLTDVIDAAQYPMEDEGFRNECKRTLDETGALIMHNFVKPPAIATLQREGESHQYLAFYPVNKHNIYLEPPDSRYPADHPRNREVSSSKGCITTDQIPDGSVLRTLYDASEFREFLCAVFEEAELHEYGDVMSSINLHYASEGQELGWHFDNSSFAVTLMIQNAAGGGAFEFVKDVRDADGGTMNYELSGKILDGDVTTNNLAMEAGTLVLFRGRNSIHRVTPVEGNRTRMLAVLAYNTEPGIPLSESARMTFYGRLG
ncbi:MAG: 2OG-Fe(II) oxygenase [Gammaproteobacteria bacterium]|nr:2OG-Fe(II) oxygenase [Gammaproteobacteria bacterium]